MIICLLYIFFLFSFPSDFQIFESADKLPDRFANRIMIDRILKGSSEYCICIFKIFFKLLGSSRYHVSSYMITFNNVILIFTIKLFLDFV